MPRSKNLRQYLPRFLAEVGVIIIGILLSLLISNYFQNRQDRQKAERYLQQIIVDLQDDLASLKNEHEIRKSQQAYAQKTLSTINSPDQEIDLFSFVGGFQQLISTINFSPKDVTFRSLESTGNLGLLHNPEIIAQLIGLYSNYYLNVNFNNEDVTAYRNNFLLPYLIQTVDFNGTLYQGKTETLQQILTDERFTNHLIYESFSVQSTVYAYARAIKEVEETIALVEGELE